MDEKTIIQNLLADNAVITAGVGGVLALFYKIWRILKTDNKSDDLDNKQKAFRDELRTEIKDLRDQIHLLNQQKLTCEKEINSLRMKLFWIEKVFKGCHSHPDTCHLIQKIGIERFEALFEYPDTDIDP